MNDQRHLTFQILLYSKLVQHILSKKLAILMTDAETANDSTELTSCTVTKEKLHKHVTFGLHSCD
jgi:hypothetical protein